MLTSFFMAFSLYSRIPVPQTEWNEKSMRWCICFLPAVGAAIGAAQGLLYWLLAHLSVGAVFRGAALTALPVLLSGAFIWTDFWTPATRSIPTEHAKNGWRSSKTPMSAPLR